MAYGGLKDMSFWSSKKIKKTKKEHRCQYCHCIIPIGSSCSNEAGTYEGDFNNYYLCQRCLVFMKLYRDNSETELGEFADDLDNTDLLDCPKCGKRNLREREWKDNDQSMELECDNCDHIWTIDLSLKRFESEVAE